MTPEQPQTELNFDDIEFNEHHDGNDFKPLKRVTPEAFKIYDDENPMIWELFQRFTFEVIRTGRKYYSSYGIFSRIRWETMIRAVDDNFKINNNFIPFYARKFMKEFPEHNGFFEIRKSIADTMTDNNSGELANEKMN